MSTIDHYAEAERLLGLARTTQEWVDDGHGGNHHVPEVIAAAQVHATLATVQRNACPHDWIAPTKIGAGDE